VGLAIATARHDKRGQDKRVHGRALVSPILQEPSMGRGLHDAKTAVLYPDAVEPLMIHQFYRCRDDKGSLSYLLVQSCSTEYFIEMLLLAVTVTKAPQAESYNIGVCCAGHNRQ